MGSRTIKAIELEIQKDGEDLRHIHNGERLQEGATVWLAVLPGTLRIPSLRSYPWLNFIPRERDENKDKSYGGGGDRTWN